MAHENKSVKQISLSQKKATEIVFKNFVNMAVAVGTPSGLVAPVLKNCDSMSFSEIEKSLGVKETHEYAVMIDTFKPLSMTNLTKEIEDKEYTFSWAK